MVRSVIAVNTIENIIQNKDLITSAITTDLAPTMKGWGMWLERVDIIDVKICSGKLFQNIQAEFRLGSAKDAEIKALTSRSALEKETLKRTLATTERSVKTNQQQ